MVIVCVSLMRLEKQLLVFHLSFLWGPNVFLRAGTCQVSIVNGDPRRCRELV